MGNRQRMTTEAVFHLFHFQEISLPLFHFILKKKSIEKNPTVQRWPLNSPYLLVTVHMIEAGRIFFWSTATHLHI